MALLTRLGRGIVAAGLAAGAVFCTQGAAQQAAAQPATELAVKAAFLFNFTRYVSWPNDVPKGTEPFRLCVVADAETRDEIERTMKGESVNGRPSETVVPRTIEEARRCQVLFVGRAGLQRGAHLLSAVRNHPVLTVGEGDDFIDKGGAIQLVVDHNRIRFDVNLDNAQRARLNVNARLLRVARTVKGDPERRR